MPTCRQRRHRRGRSYNSPQRRGPQVFVVVACFEVQLVVVRCKCRINVGRNDVAIDRLRDFHGCKAAGGLDRYAT
jgi:hypothetical protein